MSDTLRAAAQQALEALENCTSEYGHRCNRCDSEIDEGGRVVAALSAALAEPAGDTLPPLLPCPFCGKAHTLKLTTAQELAEEGEDDPEPWMHSDSFGVLCDASRPGGPGGCGASGGFFPSEREAVEAWNRRAALAAAVAEPVAWLDCERIRDLPAVDEAMRALMEDQTADNAACLVRAVLEAAAPAAPPQREPLTDEQIGDLIPFTNRGHNGAPSWGLVDMVWFARAIERAHGIAQETKGETK